MGNNNELKMDKFALSTDVLIFSVSKGEAKTCRNLSDKFFSILLVRRNKEPFKDTWCLPGGFVKENESIDEAADRILEKETNLSNIYKEQLYTFGELNRDPRTRVISTAYMALIDKQKRTDLYQSFFHNNNCLTAKQFCYCLKPTHFPTILSEFIKFIFNILNIRNIIYN